MKIVRVGPMAKSVLLAAVIGLICNGCGGLSATPAISPLMFLLPGLGQVKPAHSTNAPSMLVASKRDSSQVN